MVESQEHVLMLFNFMPPDHGQSYRYMRRVMTEQSQYVSGLVPLST